MADSLVEIRSCIKQLGNIGYSSYQTRMFLKESIGTANIKQLTESDSIYLLSVLKEQLDFAIQCKNSSQH